MKKALFLTLALSASMVHALPKGFVYLSDVAPDILQDMRYARSNNFIGNPIPGYKRGVCITTKQAAAHLKKVEQIAQAHGYTLKVYDCYRPQKAVEYFYQWSQNPKDQRNKKAFYPREEKKDLFNRDYISRTSGHTRGSTFDLSLVQLKASKPNKHPITACFDKTPAYINDNSIDMGTRFDCLDVSANIHYKKLSAVQLANRALLRKWMTENGFEPFYNEWWHFTLKNEPYPNTYFNFNVR